MPDRLDFDSARRMLDEIAPTDTWEEATLRAATDSLVQLDAEDTAVGTRGPSPRRLRPATIGLIAIAACLLAVVAVAAVVIADNQALDTIDPVDSPEPADDGSTTLAKGEGVKIDGNGQSLTVDAREQDGEVTGQLQLHHLVVTLTCADTAGDDLVLGGTVTEDPYRQLFAEFNRQGHVPVGDFVSLIIRERPPDRDKISLRASDSAESCSELVESVSSSPDYGGFYSVEAGEDIETRKSNP